MRLAEVLGMGGQKPHATRRGTGCAKSARVNHRRDGLKSAAVSVVAWAYGCSEKERLANIGRKPEAEKARKRFPIIRVVL